MNKKDIVIKIGNELIKDITSAVVSAFEKIGGILDNTDLPENSPLIYYEYDKDGNLVSGANFDKSIKTYSNSPKEIFNKENLSF